MNVDKLKARINKIVNVSGVSHQHLYDMYFFDGILNRISKSKYKNNFVFKGGFLLENMKGIDYRTTMDIDLKIEKETLNESNINKIFNEIINVESDDNIEYKISQIVPIKAGQKYEGLSVCIDGKFFNIKKRFTIDIATGDIVTPYPQKYLYKSQLLDLNFEIYAYTKETILAEKFETLVKKGTDNSRYKDFYDIGLLINDEIDEQKLESALVNTFINRGTPYNKKYIDEHINIVLSSNVVKERFEVYKKSHLFANNISFENIKEKILKVSNYIKNNENINLKDYNIDLHIVRHGQDEEDKLGGWSSNHLTDKGKEEVRNLLGDIDDHYDLFISSDLVRTKETSLILNSKLNMEIKYDSDFRETNNGDLKDLTKQEFNEKYNGLYFSSLKMDQCYPNGESPNQFYKRIKDTFIKLLEENKNKKILLVTHGGVITVIMCLIYGLPYSNLLKITPKTGTILKF